MISFFPDLNVWIALSVAGHSHSKEAWNWLKLLPAEASLVLSRYTHLGLLRLLTNEAAMGQRTLTLRQAWSVYDGWLNDPRVEFHPESRGLDASLRQTMAPLAAKRASKWVGDCYLLAYAKESEASLVTFDDALLRFARKHGYTAIRPA